MAHGCGGKGAPSEPNAGHLYRQPWYTWTNSQLTGPLFLNMLSRRESVVFLYLDIGPPAQQMKSMFLKGSVLVVDADPQFT